MSAQQGYSVSSRLEERLKGRRAVVDALRALPESYQLYYLPALRKEANADPAVDFILAHREKGLLAIVVKNGEIVEEPGGFISQYLPRKELYKIVDPIKPADTAARVLLAEFNPEADSVMPCGIAVVMPDTQRFEFSAPKPCYLFAEDVDNPKFESRLNELFLAPVSIPLLGKYLENFRSLCEFLKAHSDNDALFQKDKERVKTLAELKKATPPVHPGKLRMKIAVPVEENPAPVSAPEAEKTAISLATPPGPRTAAAAPSMPARAEVRSSPPKKNIAEKEVPVEAATQKPLAIAKAERLQTPIAIPVASTARRRPAAQPVETAQGDFFNWLQQVDEKGEGDAALSGTQWTFLVGISAAIICVMYFVTRSLVALI